MSDRISYYLSCDGWGDGKSICLWRVDKTTACKIARFQSDLAAKMFAEEFNFPLSERVQERFERLGVSDDLPPLPLPPTSRHRLLDLP